MISFLFTLLAFYKQRIIKKEVYDRDAITQMYKRFYKIN